MALPLTPQMAAAAYEYLRAAAPFSRWNLPPADEVEFHITHHRDREGDHCTRSRTRDHIIRVSAYHIKTTDMLMQLLAHEMIHARQEILRTGSRRVDHNAEFRRLAVRVCRVHGWALEGFL